MLSQSLKALVASATDAEKAEITQFIKDRYSERRKGITDEELMQAYFEYRAPIKIDRIDYSKSADTAVVQMHGKFFDTVGVVGEANSGKDSALSAVKSLIEKKFGPIQILHHESRSESAGHDACSISRISIIDKENLQHEGIGKDQDIKISAIRALIDAVNRAYIDKCFSMIAKKDRALGAKRAPRNPHLFHDVKSRQDKTRNILTTYLLPVF